MEDSYTVHRRRKAAAKKREKTPEPSTRTHLLETDDDEDEARRARMQQMAEEAEKQELEMSRIKVEEQARVDEEPKNGRKSQERATLVVPPERRKSSNSSDEVAKRKSYVDAGQSEPRARDPDTSERFAEARQVKREATSKSGGESLKRDVVKVEDSIKEKPRDILPRSKEIDDDSGKVSEPRRVEKRVKKRSKERADKYCRSTDSSEDDGERSPRRTKSPESRIRMKKSSTKPKASSGESDVVPRKEAAEKPSRERRLSNKQKLEDSEASSKEKSEGKQLQRYSHSDEIEEAPKIKKSETFPPRTKEEPPLKRSISDVKKQIIPISDDSLIEDFEKAQRNYLMREHSILDPDPSDVFEDAEQSSVLRRRQTIVTHTEDEIKEMRESSEEAKEPEEKPKSWFSWLSSFQRKKVEKVDEEERKEDDQVVQEEISPPVEIEKRVEDVKQGPPEKVTLMDFFRALRDVVAEFKAFISQNPRQIAMIKDLRNRCIAELILMIIYCGLGAFVFRFTEGAFESFYKCGVKRVKRDFLDSLWNYSHNLREDDWKSMARKKLMEFEEQLHAAHEAGVHTYSGQRSWTFLNAVVYCLTVITTIGYGHISPSTTTGRAITIVYAIFGIPMFLIILADFGKLFTRGMKFLWAFVRRLYYTGSCRKVRGTVPVQEVMKGVQLVYDLATFRRPSQMNPEDIEEIQKQAQQSQQTILNLDGSAPGTPGTPAMSNFAIDDEFNLPISVAIVILVGYIFIGATLYYMWEDWGFFESFYFVFISMSTIGFGDYVPKHPMYMMCSIIYLVFGLALTSMCINVVQVMLSDSFQQASQKIGATIGFEVAEDDGSVKPAVPAPVEVADVHTTMKESNSGEKIAPKAKQEDIDL